MGTVSGRSVACIILSALACETASLAEPVGRGARLFVTKCFPRHGKLSKEDFRQLADAGFTVVVNKWQEDVPAYCRGAAGAGLEVMTWSGGMAAAENLPGKIEKGADLPMTPGADQTITRVGKATIYTVPHSPVAWSKAADRVAELAAQSLEFPNFRGVVWDFEIYGPHKTDGYCESYDDTTFVEFLRSLAKEVPAPLTSPSERWAYLKEYGVLGLYVDYQSRLLAKQVARLRQRVDAINPEFQIGVYGWGVLLEAVKQNVATPRAPTLDCSAMTYGRTIFSRKYAGGYRADEPDRTGLKWSLLTTAKMAREGRRRSYPAVVLGGHYPQASGPPDGTQYRFTVGQAFNSAAYADGYWIWTDWHVPKPWESKQQWIDAMMEYFGEANAALDAGDFTWAARQPDYFPDPDASKPLRIVTTGGQTQTVWDATTGQRVADAREPVIEPSPAAVDGSPLRINGHEVVWGGGETGPAPKQLPVGHGVRALAVGDVDGHRGPEIITLNAGWVKIWDPDSAVMLLRFYVGPDQTGLQLAL